MAELELTDSVAVDATEVTNFLGLSDPAFLAYEYQQYLPDCAVFVQARSDGRLIGTLALMPYPLVIGGRVMMTGHAERGRVDPAYRGGGLFPALTEKCAQAAAAKGLQFIWGSTTGKMAFQRVGFLFFEGFYEHAML